MFRFFLVRRRDAAVSRCCWRNAAQQEVTMYDDIIRIITQVLLPFVRDSIVWGDIYLIVAM